MKVILKSLKRFLIFLGNITFLIPNLLIPRKKDKIVFGSWFSTKIADNSKWLFLMLSKEFNDKIMLIFITSNKEQMLEMRKWGYKCFLKFSILGLYHQFTSKFHVVDQSLTKDLFSYSNITAVKLNLWHGFPLKRIGFYFEKFWKNKIFKFVDYITTPGLSYPNYFLCLSELHARIMKKEFKLKDNQIIMSNYPRVRFAQENRILIFQNEILVHQKIEILKRQNKIIIGYFPTFRNNDTTFLGANENDCLNFLEKIEVKDIVIITKKHFAAKTDVFGNNSIINLETEFDIYTILYDLDGLITDYSSIAFDFLITNRPIFYHVYDLEYYKKLDRGFAVDFDSFTPGLKSNTLTELYNNLCSFKNDSFSVERLQLYREIYGRETYDKLKEFFRKKER